MPATSLTPPGALSRARRRYAGAAAEAPTPQRLVVLLYERLLRDLDEGIAAIDAGESPHAPLVHAQEIIEALDNALDPTVWDGAADLSAIYAHLHAELVTANVHRDRDRLTVCRQVVAPLAEAWRGAWVELTAATAAAVASPS